MKNIFVLLVSMLIVTNVFATAKPVVDSLTIDGVTVCINEEGTVFKTDMSEFGSAKLVAVYPVTILTKGPASDWAFITKGKDGAFYLSYESVKLKVCEEGIFLISSSEYDKVEKTGVVDDDEFASFASPMGKAKHKYVWGFDEQHKLYIVVYSRA